MAPAGEPGQLPAEDRSAIVTLRRWACEPLFLQRSVTFCLLVETTATLSAALVSDARTFEIAVPLPDEQERYAYLAGAPLDQDALTREKKRLIEEASGGLLTFMTSRVGLDAVAGHEGAKALLRETARALSQGRLDVVPMGYLICGPVGTGKSFIVQCFAKEIGIPVVELLNFRSKWQGQTEANLERVLALLDAIGPVAVVVDEADAALGTRETGGADGARVPASHRGRRPTRGAAGGARKVRVTHSP